MRLNKSGFARRWRTVEGCILASALMFMWGSIAFAQYDNAPYDDQTEVVESADTFEPELSPYGTWYDSDQYGRVWVPDRSVVGEDFEPYKTRGRWQVTDQGWMFVSDYPWGAIPFHYGRWFPDRELGWAWVPGDEWGPAWVRWREGGDHVGWMPEPPAYYEIPETRWVFVRRGDFIRGDIGRYVVPRERFTVALRMTAPLRVRRPGMRWYYGPEVTRVYPAGHRHRVVRIASIPRRGTYARMTYRDGMVIASRTTPIVLRHRRRVGMESPGAVSSPRMPGRAVRVVVGRGQQPMGQPQVVSWRRVVHRRPGSEMPATRVIVDRDRAPTRVEVGPGVRRGGPPPRDVESRRQAESWRFRTPGGPTEPWQQRRQPGRGYGRRRRPDTTDVPGRGEERRGVERRRIEQGNSAEDRPRTPERGQSDEGRGEGGEGRRRVYRGR